jgi:hypothetical protein
MLRCIPMGNIQTLFLLGCASALAASVVWADCSTPTGLKALLLADADSIGTFFPATDRDDNEVTEVVNLPRTGAADAGGVYEHSKGVVTRDSFMGTWIDVISLIDTIVDGTIRAKWQSLRTILFAKETVDYDDPTFAAFLGQMVSDGLMGASGPLTAPDIAARITRPGSWAELRCGHALTLVEVSTALNVP